MNPTYTMFKVSLWCVLSAFYYVCCSHKKFVGEMFINIFIHDCFFICNSFTCLDLVPQVIWLAFVLPGYCLLQCLVDIVVVVDRNGCLILSIYVMV